MKVLPHVMRNINEFNIPAGNSHGYEILYFGVNLILMLDYRLSFDIEVKNSNKEIIQVLIISRKDIPAWKENNNGNSEIGLYYGRQGIKINDVFRPTISDAYAFVLNNPTSSNNAHGNIIKTVEVTLIHNWQQEVKESQLKEYKVH
jgi:nucleoid-associated protein YejK